MEKLKLLFFLCTEFCILQKCITHSNLRVVLLDINDSKKVCKELHFVHQDLLTFGIFYRIINLFHILISSILILSPIFTYHLEASEPK